MTGKKNKKTLSIKVNDIGSDSASEESTKNSDIEDNSIDSDYNNFFGKNKNNIDSDGGDDNDTDNDEETNHVDEATTEDTNIVVKKSIKNSNEIFKELIKKQLSDVPPQWKLNINDMKRICKYIDSSIFDKKNCCIWNGYITNMNNSNKGTYVNFYFRNKKVALHRLLYSNFVAPLDSSEYLKFNCDNKGICCNINHYEKYKYSKNNGMARKEQKHREPKKEIKEITIVGSDEPEKLIINFD